MRERREGGRREEGGREGGGNEGGGKEGGEGGGGCIGLVHMHSSPAGDTACDQLVIVMRSTSAALMYSFTAMSSLEGPVWFTGRHAGCYRGKGEVTSQMPFHASA